MKACETSRNTHNTTSIRTEDRLQHTIKTRREITTTMPTTAATCSSESGRLLLQLIKRGDREAATFVLTTTAPAVTWLEMQDNDGNGTALVWAACHGFEELVVMLLVAGADVNARAESNGLTALHAAAERGRTTVVRLIASLSPLQLHIFYTVSQKTTDTDVAHYNFNTHQPTFVIFGRDVAERVCYQMVICYPTSPN